MHVLYECLQLPTNEVHHVSANAPRGQAKQDINKLILGLHDNSTHIIILSDRDLIMLKSIPQTLHVLAETYLTQLPWTVDLTWGQWN